MKKYTYVIVGNSAGGLAAARQLRKADGSAPVLMLSEEEHAGYSRPLISKQVSEGKGIDEMHLQPPEFYDEWAIELRLGTRALSLDTRQHTIETSGGHRVGWERLLLATGSRPIVPPIPGREKSGVFTFATFGDAHEIARRLPAVKHAVVVGGGFIGLSAADALRKRGVAVTIVEMLPRLLSAMLDQTASAMVEDAASAAGARVLAGRQVVSIDSDVLSPGTVSGVTLDDGSLIPCEMVIMAVGVRPRIELTKGVLSVNRGIIVDAGMRTSCDDVFACGDVCETRDFVRGEKSVIAVWPNAVSGGAVAGANMTGLDHAYAGSTTLNSLPYFGLSVGSAGVVDGDSSTTEEVVARGRDFYRKVVLRDGVVAGMVFAGDTTKCGLIYMLMRRKVHVGEWKEALVRDEFGLLSLPDELWHDEVALDPVVDNPPPPAGF